MNKNKFIAMITAWLIIYSTAHAEVSIFHPGKHGRKPHPEPNSDPSNRIYPAGEITNRSVDLIFRPNSLIDFKLTPKLHLYAGKNEHGDSVAQFTLYSMHPSRVGVRWTRNTGITNNNRITLKGVNNKNNLISLYIHNSTPVYPLFIWDTDGWAITMHSTKHLEGEIKIDGDQFISADTYILSMDASAFVF